MSFFPTLCRKSLFYSHTIICFCASECVSSACLCIACFFIVQNTENDRGVSVWPWLTEGCWWGLHPKKGSLSRWQHQDWQDVILHGNSVSQPVSLPVRQPLTPLNLAFCWAVTRLAATLHAVDLINCTKKARKHPPSPLWTLRATTLRLEASLKALMTKTPLSHLPFHSISASPDTPSTALDS